MAQKQLQKSFTSPLSCGSTRETLDSFDYETKFIVLNFMRRSPHDIPHRSTFSPQTSTSESEYRFHLQGNLTSKSLPSSPPKHYHHPSHRPGGYNNDSKLCKMQRVSEDNIHYKYQKFKSSLEDELETDGGGSFDSSLDASQDTSNKDKKMEHDASNTGKHQVTLGNKKRDSMSLHQFRQMSMNRAASSMSVHYSADDEDDGTSCGSSSMGSLSNSASNLRKDGRREGPVDLQQVVSRLPTVKSESEMENEMLGNLNIPSNSNQNISDLGLEDINIELKSEATGDQDDTFENDPALSTSLSLAAGAENVSRLKSVDRSKLKLDIQEQSSFENTEKIEKWEAIAASLRAELEDEMTSFESEVEEAIKKNVISPVASPFLTPLSPQSEAARFLARIGDELQDEYRDRLDLSIRRLVLHQQFTYEDFKCIARDMIDKTLPGWRQVVLLMLFGQRAAWKVVELGQNKISDMVDYTTRLVADMTADFIISQGGWGAVMNSDPSLSSESPATNASESPSEAAPLTKCHWVASPVGDVYVRSAPSPGSEIASLAPSLSTSSEIQTQAADGDHLVRISSPLIHVMTTSPVPKEGWAKKENVTVGSTEPHSETQSNNNNVTDLSTFADDFAELESSQGEGNEANNNSSAPNEISETVGYEVPVPYLEEDNLPSSSGEHIGDPGAQSVWYNWLSVPEHLVLLSCLLASIGIGALLSTRNKS